MLYEGMTLEAWTLMLNVITLLVIVATAIAAVAQLGRLREQNTLTAQLAVLSAWNEPEFRAWRDYVTGELQTKLKDPQFLAEYDQNHIDRSRHPEIHVCDWFEQIGAFMKYGLLDSAVMLDTSSGPVRRMWIALEPAIMRLRKTRGDWVYENFEYFAVLGCLHLRDNPGGKFPKKLSRMRDLKRRPDVEQSSDEKSPTVES
jgi:hypothetical protein